MRISYDKEADILNVWFSTVDPPYINLENENGDVVRIIEKDGTVAGLIIYDAMYRMKRNADIEVPEIGVTLSNDITQTLIQNTGREHANF